MRLWLQLIAWLLTVFPAGLTHAQTDPPPNLIFVLVDDLRWDELSCAGNPVVHTPNIDRIAHEGARFRNAFANTPLCSPSRACFLTGRHAHRHGIVDNTNRSEQSHRLITFPLILQRSGYETAYIGKWHMGNDDSPRPGFDHWAGLKGQGTSFDPAVNCNGSLVEFQGHTTDVLNRLASEFIQAPHERPFCLYLSHKALHPELVQRDDGSISDPSAARFLPADRHRNLYADAAIPRRFNCTDTLEGKPALQRSIAGLPPLGPDTATSDETIRDRWRMLAAVDEGIGQLFSALDDSGILDSTVIVFAGDHGYWYGEHGLSVERRLAYEEAIRIPLLIRYPPQVARGQVADELAGSIDIAPTLLELAGAGSEYDMDGRSLLPLPGDESRTVRPESVLIQYYSDTVFPRVLNMGYRAVRTQRYKYIRYTDLNGMDELYDLRDDPYEMRNVIDETDYRETLQQLQNELERLTAG